MNGKRRGIRLKSVNEEQEGYRALFDYFAVDPQRSTPMDLTGGQLVKGVDQRINVDSVGADSPEPAEPSPPAFTARQRIARLVREELEETLRLLDKALTKTKKG